MFFDKITTINYIDYRIRILSEHGVEKNRKLINALLREKRNLEDTHE